MTLWLTKSDFKVAAPCATKLYFKKQKYPSNKDVDPYLELLADGGFMVGRMAQLLYPDGILIEAIDPGVAVVETKRAIAAGANVLFEAAIEWNGCLVRVDVLRFKPDGIDLIEVKSKGYDRGEGFLTTRGEVRGLWREYIDDVTFQRWVVRNAFPGQVVRSYLLTPDKGLRSKIDGLPGLFHLRRDHSRVIAVDFVGDPEAIRGANLLGLWPTDNAADVVEPEVVDVAETLLPYLQGGPRRPPPEPGYKCRECEYRLKDEATHPNGYRECWGPLADTKPSLFELTNLGHVKVGGQPVAETLIRQGKVSLFDVPTSALTTKHAPRQLVQIEATRNGREWRSPDLRPVLAALPYPLHFVDFETSRLALPYHAGMRPWEQVAFQWSCLTIERPGGPPRHSEWINLEESFPNVAFAQALRKAVGDSGSILTWSFHEETTLKEIMEQIDQYAPELTDLKAWLVRTVSGGRMFDLWRHTQQNFYTPEMHGSASIKAVLPAVWRACPQLRTDPWFVDYSREQDGRVWDPYATLPAIDIYEDAEVVEEGTGAMRAYQEMLYGAGRDDPKVKDAWRKLLLQYCKLDTVAMVIIWKYFMEHWAVIGA